MEVTRKTIQLASYADTIKLTPLGDVHVGAAGCDETAFIEWVDLIAKDPNHYTILMGDMAECILPDDRRFDADEVADWLWARKNRSRIADAQYEWVYEQVKKIPSERILGILRGNHENTIKSKHYRDLALDLARNLNIPYLDEQAFTQLHFTVKKSTKTALYDIYSIHGSQSGRKAGGKINLIQDLTGFIDADLILMGHVHDKIATRDVKLYMDEKGNFRSRERLYVITGTFLKTYSEGTAGYGARANFRPTSVGPITVHIKPFHHTKATEPTQPKTWTVM